MSKVVVCQGRLIIQLPEHIKKERLSKQKKAELLKSPNLLLNLKKSVDLYNNHIWGLHSDKLKSEKEIEVKRKRLLIL